MDFTQHSSTFSITANDIFTNHQKADAQRKHFLWASAFLTLHRPSVKCIPANFPHTDGGHQRNGYFVLVLGWFPGRIRAENRKTDWHSDPAEAAWSDYTCFDSCFITSKRAYGRLKRSSEGKDRKAWLLLFNENKI